MPRYAPSQLRWSVLAQTYVLSSGDQVSEHALSSDWLEQIDSFSFHSRWGMHYTVRKQKAQRGSSYWYAYRRLHGRIVKRYLGKTAGLTFARLEEIARLLESESDTDQLSPQSQQEIVLPQPTPDVLHEEDAPLPVPPVVAPPLLFSKLSPPRLHTFLLDRSRLFALLDTGRECHLTLLSAPAGFGKTTLICQWIAARRASPHFPPVAWVSLEAADNDPLRFWRYLIAGCQTFQVDLQEVHSVFASMSPQPPFMPSSLEPVLTILLNALVQSPSGGILVLEDYHVITEPSIHETLSFFLEHLPTTFHLIIITRSDPPFSLARLRARNMLYEIRTSDLRFSQEETRSLLHQALPFQLEASTIERLHEQLEGWGVGLHLVKLALQRTATQASGELRLPLFPQSNAPFQEYFVSEVLDLQPELVQQFLLQTSILSRLTASLCDAVTEQHNAQDMLTLLERTNLFLEPLTTASLMRADDVQQWYRYHALFSEAIRNEARRRFGEDQLHHLFIRASYWYEMHGNLDEAIDAALAAQDDMRAAILIERFIEEQTLSGDMQEPHTLHRWLEQLPETLLEQHPILCLSYATTLLFQSASWLPDAVTLRLVEKLLQRAEDRFRAEHHLSKLREVYAFRALVALRQGDMQAATRCAKQALDGFEQTQHPPMQESQQIWRGLSLSIVAEEWIVKGHFQQARIALLEAHALCVAVENHAIKRVAMIKLARVFFEQGEFQQAISLSRQVLAEAREKGLSCVLCHALAGLAALCYECNELESASQHAQEAITVSQSHHLLYYEVQATLLLARVQQAQGQISVAQQQLAALFDKMSVSSFPHLAQDIQAAQARLALSIGDHMTLQRWATGRSPHHDFSQEIEEGLLVCRWLRIQGKLEEASDQLERLLVATQQAGHTRCLLKIQVEMVLVAVAGKRKTEAQHLLREVLAQTFVGNAMRLFLDAGEQMAILLRSLLPQVHDQPLQTYIRTLLKAFPAPQLNGTPAQSAALLEPLSSQEMRVLRLLVQHRSNAEIANELVVSVNTVRTQVQSIYHKLGVHTRNAASEVAHELRLIS
jgi:LuxR family maltose regulon positive regulatory protein